jgi:peptide/nickel transport system substrate-binding protein
MRNIESQRPQAICELNSGEGINRHLLVNYHKPPFDDPQIRRAMALSINRHAFVDTIAQGEGQIGGVLQPPPAGLWGMPPDEVKQLPGTTPTWRRTAPRAARSCGNSATAPTNTWTLR